MCWNASFKPVLVAPYWPFLCVLHVQMMWSGPRFETCLLCEQSCGTLNIKKTFPLQWYLFYIIALSVSYQIQGCLLHVAVIVKTKITFVLKEKSRDASPEQEVLPFSQICAAWPAQIWTWMSAWWWCDCSNAHIVRGQQVGCSERSRSLSLEILNSRRKAEETLLFLQLLPYSRRRFLFYPSVLSLNWDASVLITVWHCYVNAQQEWPRS